MVPEPAFLFYRSEKSLASVRDRNPDPPASSIVNIPIGSVNTIAVTGRK
jgi:hypothetical protein